MVGRLSAGLGVARLTAAGIDTRVERFVAMGTRIELHVFGRHVPDALLAGRRAIEAVDDALTIHRPSPTTAINERLMAGDIAVTRDPVLLDALSAISAAWRETGGLFDPTVGSGAGAAWPAVRVDAATGRVECTTSVAFDFGGFGKGFALDRAAAAMRDAGVTCAFLSAGESSFAVIGDHPLGGAWPIAVPHPFDPDRWLVELGLRDAAVSVSSTIGADAPGRSPTMRSSDGTIVTAAATSVAVDSSGAAAEAMSTALLVADDEAAAQLIAADPDHRFLFAFPDPHLATT